MTTKKNTGSYYTPGKITTFIVNQIQDRLAKNNTISILEPSVGDGNFLKAIMSSGILNSYANTYIKGIDVNKEELEKAKENSTDERVICSFECTDFLKYTDDEQALYDLVIGNPPYIKKNLLEEEQINICQQIHQSASLSSHSIKNIWTAFVIKSTQLLKANGILAFVLPSEFLQVKFAEEIRKYIQEHFERTEIYTFSDLLFECKGQDTIVLIGYKNADQKGVFYTNIEDESNIHYKPIELERKDIIIHTETKWTHHILTGDELTFLSKLKEQLDTVDTYCNSKPGIVTAANSYFIIDEATEIKYELTPYTKPIIQKGMFVNGSVLFNEESYTELIQTNKPSKILCFSKEDIENFNQKVKEYLEIGESLHLQERYKCRIRDHWFIVPNISTPSQGFFFKRCHLYPKFLKNEANVLVTDSAYKVDVIDGYSINDLIYSFYNSLTLAFAELEGRYYGGGVLELTPMEFKKLPLPYLRITDKVFNDFVETFEAKKSIEDIIELNDFSILNSTLKLNSEEIRLIRQTKDKLIRKRMKQ